jgi:ribonuclease-3
MKEREITALETALSYHFHRRAVIEQAVTHSSQAREQEAQQAGESKYKVHDNEQLEFLGDAILALVTSEELFQRFPQFREGELSKLRAHVVSERHLIRVAQQLELGHYLRLGRGEEKSGGRSKTALLVDALEAIRRRSTWMAEWNRPANSSCGRYWRPNWSGWSAKAARCR